MIRVIERPPPEDSERSRALREAQRLRRECLVPLFLMRTSDVPDAEYLAARTGVAEALAASGQRRTIVDFSNSTWSDGDYSSADWYVLQAMREAQWGPPDQVDAFTLLRLMATEPWQLQEAHWEVSVVGTDLRTHDPNINFVYGLTDPNFPASVQSIHRFMEEKNQEVRLAMIRRLLRHEVGHMLGLPGWNRPNLEESLGTHCTNLCTMRQGLSFGAWRNLTIQEQRAGVHFCSECQRVLDNSRDQYKPVPKK